jgi:decaprenylphospho-beta-D-erythro-pentofuranosid-2-ulose 2-reductase
MGGSGPVFGLLETDIGMMDASTASSPLQNAKAATPSKRVVILGALSAIAIATARIYAAEGAALLLAARNAERLGGLAGDLRARGAARVEIAALDLENGSSQARQHLDAWSKELGGIDHVLVIYGYLGSQEKASGDPAELGRIVSSNFSSAVQWCEAAAAIFRAQKRGSLVAISSVAGDRGRQSNYAYGAAKGGLALYVQGLAHSLAPLGARAVAVKPGFVDTPMTDGMNKQGALWAKPEAIGRAIRQAADRGGPIQYAPGLWRMIMLVIRTVPSFVFHKTKL